MRTSHPSLSPVILLATGLLLLFGPARHAEAQESSIVRQQSEEYSRYDYTTEEEWDRLRGAVPNTPGLYRPVACDLKKIVFGWHPYWMGSAYTGYDYSLLSDVSYFSYEVDTATGSYKNLHDWKTTNLVPLAKNAGARVNLCVTLFSGHAAVLGNPARRATLIDSLVALIRLRNADGVNVDFEAVPASQRANLTAFMIDLARQFHTRIPGSQVSMAIPAVDWSNVFDVATMAHDVDLFIIMGYDYHWSTSPGTGPVSPKNNGAIWSPYDVTRSVNSYLAKGIPPTRLCLGLPYYGLDWACHDTTLGATTIGAGKAVLYSSARTNAEDHGRRWEYQSSTPYYLYRSDTTWHQAWYDDDESLGMKYDMVTMKNLAGIGIWALGYDAGRSELWDLLREKFTTCGASPCVGTMSDMGGPAGNYYGGEHYTFVIAPRDARSVALTFENFDVADDRLRLYDGTSTSAPMLGEFTGAQNPGTVTATSGSMTVEFESNDTLTAPGWNAHWLCSTLPSGVDATAHEAAPSITLTAAPNPTMDAVTIGYTLPTDAPVRLRFFDLLGAEVITMDLGPRSRGRHTAVLDFRDGSLPPGAYLVRLDAGALSGRMTVVHR